MTTAVAEITAHVKALYEVHPYPLYPLLALPAWQDGYLANSRFAQRLALDLGSGGVAILPGQKVSVLIGGAGEILPYVIRQWEPSAHRVIAVDLSKRSLNRARFRTWRSFKACQFVNADLQAMLTADGHFTHIDVYGVLHHMANPGQALRKLASALAPGGTLRLMVYNSTARNWIWHLQRAFQLLGLNSLDQTDLRAAQDLLVLASQQAPVLSDRLGQMGPSLLRNTARFADAFLHPREARLSFSAWFQMIADAELTAVGLFDRYGELDDLANPLWHCPSVLQLEERALDRRFENNLELFLTKPAKDRTRLTVKGRSSFFYKRALPPRFWFSFAETSSLPLTTRLQVWFAHLDWTIAGKKPAHARMLDRLPLPAAQRLARLGALLPGQIGDIGRRSGIAAPMTNCISPPTVKARSSFKGTTVEARVEDLLRRRGHTDQRRQAAVIARLEAAQR